MTTKKSRADSERERLVSRIASLFVRKGFLNTTVRDIVEYCDISMGKLYYYVRSKNDILSMFEGYTSSRLDEYSKRTIEAMKHMEPVEALREAVRNQLEYIEQNQDIQVFWYQEAKNLDKEHLARLLKMEEKSAAVYQKLIEAGCKKGVFKVDSPALAAHNIQVLLHMWAFRRWYLRKHYKLDAFITEQFNYVLNMLHCSRKDGGD